MQLFHFWSRDVHPVQICCCVQNFIKIGWFFAEIWRYNDFKNGGRPPSWNCFITIRDHKVMLTTQLGGTDWPRGLTNCRAQRLMKVWKGDEHPPTLLREYGPPLLLPCNNTHNVFTVQWNVPRNSSSRPWTKAPQAPLEIRDTDSGSTSSLGASSAHFWPVDHSPDS